jgi:hypothetical protein
MHAKPNNKHVLKQPQHIDGRTKHVFGYSKMHNLTMKIDQWEKTRVPTYEWASPMKIMAIMFY